MADNFNVSLGGPSAEEVTAAGLVPGQPGMNLGDTMYANMLKQQQDEQAVQQAVEHTKQAKIGTSEAQTELDTQGFLSEKGQVPKAQALSELKIMLSKEGWADEDIANAVQEATDTWPDVVNAYDIRGFISGLRKEKSAPLTGGTPFKATAADSAKKDENGDALIEGQYYTAKVDPESGDSTYIRSGEPAATTNANAKAGGASDKELKEFGKEIDGMMKTRFGATGQLATTIFRADRALNTLHSAGDLTKQDLNNISTDIAAIYQGGVPGQQQIVENAYGTTLTNLMDTLRHYTGVLSGFGLNQKVLSDTKAKLNQVLTDMRNSAIASLKQIFEGVVAHYPTLSPQDPAVVNVIEQTMKGLTSGLLNAQGQVLQPVTTVPTAGAVGAGTPQGGAQAPQERKTASGISYTVS